MTASTNMTSPVQTGADAAMQHPQPHAAAKKTENSIPFHSFAALLHHP